MTGPELIMVVAFACAPRGTAPDALAHALCPPDAARAEDQERPAAPAAAQAPTPTPPPKEVFYSILLGVGFSSNSTDGEFARFSAWKPYKHGINVDVGEQHNGDDSSVGVGLTYWRQLDSKTTCSVFASGGSAPFVPLVAFGASITRPLFTVGLSLGASYTDWRNGAYTTEVSVGAVRWLPHFIVGGSATYSQGEPADFMGWRGNVGVSYYVWHKTYVSTSVDFGNVRQREFQFDTRSRGVNVGFSQWLTETSGINVNFGRSIETESWGMSASWFKEW